MQTQDLIARFVDHYNKTAPDWNKLSGVEDEFTLQTIEFQYFDENGPTDDLFTDKELELLYQHIYN